jgi:uncharacterized membrane protein YcaP (DUF421 family)
MWDSMFVMELPLAEKVARTVLVYLLVLVLLRVASSRGLATVNTLDVVVLLLLAGVVENSVLRDDMTITGGAVSAVTLIAVNWALGRLVDMSPTAAKIFQGKATTVIEDGHVVKPALRRLRMRPSELDHAIRSQHGDDISEIAHGQLTPSGRLVLTLKYDEQSSTKADIAALASQLRRVEALLIDGRAEQTGAAR